MFGGRLNMLLAVLVAGAFIIAHCPVLATFPTGKERIYNLLNDVRLDDRKGGPSIGYRVTGSLRVGSVWGGDELKLFQFHLNDPRLHVPPKAASASAADELAFVGTDSHLNTALNEPFYAVWQLGTIKKLYVHGKEDVSLINLKKALVSLFQYQLLDGEEDEQDVAGTCSVGYQTSGRQAFTKIWRRCAEPADEVSQRRRPERPIGVRVESDRRAEYRVTDEGTLDRVTAEERHRYALQANENAGAELRSTLTLRFDGSISNIATLDGKTAEEAVRQVKGLKKHSLQTDSSVPHGLKEDLPFKSAAVLHKSDLTDDSVGSARAALALLRLSHAARVVDVPGFQKVLKARSMQPLRSQLFDVLAATQTLHAHETALRELQLTASAERDLAERYLQGLAVGSRPVPKVIEMLLRLAKTGQFAEDTVRDTLLQTLAAMARHLLAANAGTASNATATAERIVGDVHAFIARSLDKCEDPSCQELYLRALNNLQAPASVEQLFRFVDNADGRVALDAMQALRRFPAATWNADRLQLFRAIFYQLRRRYDSSIRTLALDILFEQRPKAAEIRDLLRLLTRPNDGQYEVRKYLLQKLQLLAERCPRFASLLRAIIVADARLNNYDVLAQRGLTTALQRRFAGPPSFNSTVLSVQEIHKGVLKRGVVDMSVGAGPDEFSVFTLGLYAGGLSSFVSSDATDEDDEPAAEEEPANAGMEITVQGAYFRPLQFFGSQSELMGHAWSGTASEATPAYQATTLLHDHEERVRLLNGATLALRVRGAISIDLNGQVQFSLWNRNAHCQVDKNTGIAVEGVFAVETSFVNVKTVTTVTKEPKLSLLADIDFAGAPKLCIQLSQPETELKHQIEKQTKVHGTNVERSQTRTHLYHLPGITHALNQKNNEMCSNILE